MPIGLLAFSRVKPFGERKKKLKRLVTSSGRDPFRGVNNASWASKRHTLAQGCKLSPEARIKIAANQRHENGQSAKAEIWAPNLLSRLVVAVKSKKSPISINK